MKDPEQNKLSPQAVAMQWTSRITTIVLEMILPGIGGGWLDKRWDTNFLALTGFAFGLTLGIWHLIQMTKPKDVKTEKQDDETDDKKSK